MKQVPVVSASTAASSIPSTLHASLTLFVDPSFSLVNDEPDNWSTDAGLKLKVGVVSVTVEQQVLCLLQRVDCKTVNGC